MKTEQKTYTISVFTENSIGMLNRISILFTRRHINIESITASESEVEDVYRYTIVLKATKKQVDKLLGQLEKLIDVIKAFIHEESEVVMQELALYKVRTNKIVDHKMEAIIRDNNARILSLNTDYLVLEKTGHASEIQALFDSLKTFGVLEFARSGGVAITKPMKEMSQYLTEAF